MKTQLLRKIKQDKLTLLKETLKCINDLSDYSSTDFSLSIELSYLEKNLNDYKKKKKIKLIQKELARWIDEWNEN